MAISAMAQQYYNDKEFGIPVEHDIQKKSGLSKLSKFTVANQYNIHTPFSNHFTQVDMRKANHRKKLFIAGTIASVALGVGMIAGGAASGAVPLVIAGIFLVVAPICLHFLFKQSGSFSTLRNI